MTKIKCLYCGKIIEGEDDPKTLFDNHISNEHCGHIPWNLFVSREACYENIFYKLMKKYGKLYEILDT